MEQSLNPSSSAMGRPGSWGGWGGPAPLLMGTSMPSWEHPSVCIPGGSTGKVKLPGGQIQEGNIQNQTNQEPPGQRGWESQHQTHLQDAEEVFNLPNWRKI